jgi:hypothetical protein
MDNLLTTLIRVFTQEVYEPGHWLALILALSTATFGLTLLATAIYVLMAYAEWDMFASFVLTIFPPGLLFLGLMGCYYDSQKEGWPWKCPIHSIVLRGECFQCERTLYKLRKAATCEHSKRGREAQHDCQRCAPYLNYLKLSNYDAWCRSDRRQRETNRQRDYDYNIFER